MLSASQRTSSSSGAVPSGGRCTSSCVEAASSTSGAPPGGGGAAAAAVGVAAAAAAAACRAQRQERAGGGAAWRGARGRRASSLAAQPLITRRSVCAIPATRPPGAGAPPPGCWPSRNITTLWTHCGGVCGALSRAPARLHLWGLAIPGLQRLVPRRNNIRRMLRLAEARPHAGGALIKRPINATRPRGVVVGGGGGKRFLRCRLAAGVPAARRIKEGHRRRGFRRACPPSLGRRRGRPVQAPRVPPARYSPRRSSPGGLSVARGDG